MIGLADRQQAAYSYSGILATGAVVVRGNFRTTVNQRGQPAATVNQRGQPTATLVLNE